MNCENCVIVKKISKFVYNLTELNRVKLTWNESCDEFMIYFAKQIP